MPSLSERINDHQVAWRRRNVSSEEMGTWRKKRYPWILPRNLWEEGLWPGIRTGSNNALPAYLRQARVQKHSGVRNLKSSWMLCANLYFPFRNSRRDRDLLGSFLRHHVAPQIESLDAIELERNTRRMANCIPRACWERPAGAGARGRRRRISDCS